MELEEFKKTKYAEFNKYFENDMPMQDRYTLWGFISCAIIDEMIKLFPTEQSEGQMQTRVMRAFQFRSITNEGLPAKFVVQLLREGGMECADIKKILFSSSETYFGVKRKWKNVWYCEERIVLKPETTLAIAREVYWFIDKHA